MKPILFSTEMVRAILDGRKSCTRRLVKPQPKGMLLKFIKNLAWFENIYKPIKPRYQVGDILYVRETFCPNYFDECIARNRNGNKNAYKADYNKDVVSDVVPEHKWHPSIHMPKEAARIFLKVTDVRVERLQDITEEETEKEGFEFTPPCLHQVDYESYCDLDGPCISRIKYCDMSLGELFGKVLWNSTVDKKQLDQYGWNANPYVWVIEFERCEKPEEPHED